MATPLTGLAAKEIFSSLKKLGDRLASLILDWSLFFEKRKLASQRKEDFLTISSKHTSPAEYLSVMEELLRKRLRQYPRWCEGHLRLGRIALEQKESGLAHSCGILSGICALDEFQSFEAQWLIGKSQLQLGAAKEALETFSKLLVLPAAKSKQFEVAEDIAAALLIEGKDKQALELLQQVGNDLSAQARAVLSSLIERTKPEIK